MSARKPSRRPGVVAASAHHADHAGLADAGMHLVHPAQAQRLLHPVGGVDLLEAEFGVRMQVAPQRGELGVVLVDLRERPAMGREPRRRDGCKHQ
jgi:hypothetical protein